MNITKVKKQLEKLDLGKLDEYQTRVRDLVDKLQDDFFEDNALDLFNTMTIKRKTVDNNGYNVYTAIAPILAGAFVLWHRDNPLKGICSVSLNSDGTELTILFYGDVYSLDNNQPTSTTISASNFVISGGSTKPNIDGDITGGGTSSFTVPINRNNVSGTFTISPKGLYNSLNQDISDDPADGNNSFTYS